MLPVGVQVSWNGGGQVVGEMGQQGTVWVRKGAGRRQNEGGSKMDGADTRKTIGVVELAPG